MRVADYEAKKSLQTDKNLPRYRISKCFENRKFTKTTVTHS